MHVWLYEEKGKSALFKHPVCQTEKRESKAEDRVLSLLASAA